MKKSKRELGAKRLGRRDFLIKSSGALAATAIYSINIRSSAAADTVNVGGLYPVTGSFAQIGQGCVNAAKLAVQMVNDAGGIKSLGGAKLNLIVSDVQSDPTVTRTETDRLISSYKPAAIHGAFASALTLIASEVAERAKVPLLTGSSSTRIAISPSAIFARFPVRVGAAANVQAGERSAKGRGDIRKHRLRHVHFERIARAGASPRRGNRPVRALFRRVKRCQSADQQGQGIGRE